MLSKRNATKILRKNCYKKPSLENVTESFGVKMLQNMCV